MWAWRVSTSSRDLADKGYRTLAGRYSVHMLIFSPFRAAMVMVGIGCGLVGLTGRVAYLQTYGREQTIRWGERQQHQNETLFARRGSIFDTTGLLMAGTVQTQCLFIDPKFMQDQFQADGRSLVDMDKAIDKLAPMLTTERFESS